MFGAERCENVYDDDDDDDHDDDRDDHDDHDADDDMIAWLTFVYSCNASTKFVSEAPSPNPNITTTTTNHSKTPHPTQKTKLCLQTLQMQVLMHN